MEIVQVGATVLRQVGRHVDPAEVRTNEFQRLIESMRTTMKEAPGVGLAAPQIGRSLQLAVAEDPPEFIEQQTPDQAALTERDTLPFMVLINPILEPVGDETAEFFEGCLSVDGYRALVLRHRRVHLRWTDATGAEHDREFAGWPARILQHEVDHLHGIVYTDRMLPRSLVTTKSWSEQWAELPIAEVHKALRIDAS